MTDLTIFGISVVENDDMPIGRGGEITFGPPIEFKIIPWQASLEEIRPKITREQYRTGLLYNEALDLFWRLVARDIVPEQHKVLFDRMVLRIDRRFEAFKEVWWKK